ncbi:MAG TPA: mechanosensitive ion channel family protein, partial [Mariprofundaceae bacterium]|nr:mechanosensitive ion channel family protein [Mariprofundaceae bacterium]
MGEMWGSLQQLTLLDIAATRWLLAIAALFVTIVMQRLVLRAFHVLTQNLAAHTETKVDDLLLAAAEKPASWLILVIGTIIAVHLLNPPVDVFPLIPLADSGGRIISIMLGIWFLWRLIDGLGAYFTARAARSSSSLDDQLV